ncbi:MAG: PTS sugar transporter subunit IIB [Bulleidia sp.]|nr:PTS sugar transporter subunit IIB [Bulleidia sp.]
MKKIVLLCNMGLSTSALVKKMQEAASAENYDCSINAYPASEAQEMASDADVVLIGPQVSYLQPQVQAKLPGKPVEVINMMDYGMMNGKNVLKRAKELMGEKN